MSPWVISWIGAVLLLILWWDLHVLTPGLLLLAIGYVLTQHGGGTWFADLLGIALVPVLGGVALSFGFVRARVRAPAALKPPVLTRLLAALTILAAASLLPLERLLPYAPDPLQNLTTLRLLAYLVFSGLAYLSLAELPVFMSFGFLWLLLAANILIQSAYGELTSLMLLVNILELCTILLLSRQALRLPMWLSWHQEGASA